MAVTGGNTETVQTVLTIDATKSASSMKELREQIKELKNELVGLDQDSQEYADTLVVLGEKMHQFKEINEQVARTNTDFGDTIGNVTNVMAGGVAAVQGLTAGLSLLGVQMGDDNKLTQTLVKSMALLQSLSSMDKAIKSFRALATVIKSNIAAAGGLSKALKVLATNNPFGLMLVAATALVAVIAKISSKQKEAEEKTKEHEQAVKDLTIEYYSLADAMNGLDNARLWRSDSKTQQGVEELLRKFQAFANETTNRGRDINRVWDDFYNRIVTTGTEAEKKLVGMAQAQYNYNDALAGMQRAMNYNPTEGGWLQTETEREEMIAKYRAAANEQEQKRNNLYKVYLDSQKKDAKNTKDLEKQKYDLAMKRLNLQKTLDETAITAQYEEEKRAAEGNAEELLRIEERYQAARLELNQKYYTDAIALAEQFKATRKTESDRLDVDQTIANLNKSLQEATDSYADFTVEQERSRKERELEIQTLQAEIAALDNETEVIRRNSEITTQFDQETLETLKQKQEQYGLLLGASSTYYEQEREFLRELMILENEHNDLTEQRTGLDNQLQNLQSQYEQGLIAVEEYEKQKAEIRKQYAEVQAQLDENEVEQERTKLNRKKELNEAYKSAISNITNQLVNLLNTMGDAEDVSFEDQKKMKIAAATISTIQGGIDAFMSYMNSGIPQPYNSILGAAAAAATVAMGMAEIQKIRNTKKESSGTVSSSAMNTVMTPPQIVNLNAVNDEIELPDTRVYVLESDITDAQNRVRVTETNSTF